MLRPGFLQRMDHRSFSGDQERRRFLSSHHVLPHLLRTANHVANLKNILRALRMSHHKASRILFLHSDEILNAEDFMHHARTRPQDHLATSDLHKVSSKMLIGNEQNLLVFRNTINDVTCVATGHDPIAQRLWS